MIEEDATGFNWGPVRVSRIAEIKGMRTIGVKTKGTNVEIYVSPTGRSVTIYKNGKRMK